MVCRARVNEVGARPSSRQRPPEPRIAIPVSPRSLWL
jgi:hypothetical protein